MYYAWLACTFAPWMSVPTQAVPRKKPLSPWAVEIARERLWLTLPNLIVLGDVVSHFRGVIQAKSAFLGKGMGKTDAESQEQVKKDFASWGPNWRTCMVMAILHECMEGGDLTEGKTRSVAMSIQETYFLQSCSNITSSSACIWIEVFAEYLFRKG